MSTIKSINDTENFEPLDGPEFDKLYAMIDKRAIHIRRKEAEGNIPVMSDDATEGVYKLAYKYILNALEYIKQFGANEKSNTTLRNAAQFLEKIYWDEPHDLVKRTDELEIAAFAYYLAGYYARAYVLMQGVSSSTNNSNNLMRLMFLRKLPEIRELALKTLSQEQFRDRFLANSVNRGQIDSIEAINIALEGTLHRVYLLFYEYARTGNDDLIEQAIDFCNVGIIFAIDQQLRAWWWTLYCTVSILHEYHRNSLWTCLRSMMEDDSSNLVRRYIRAAFWRRGLPILELWRSQSHVIENIKDGQSYCVKMPTGSGKTRIAELAILKFLLDTQNESDKKCLYIAPYRALATELEQSLKRSFADVGIGVSQLYGSYDLNPAESLIIEGSKILIATPEKMDAFLRYNADIAKQVGLIIVDEGHIIDSGERGLRFELFIHRLVRRFERNGIRMLFISAVMPNIDQFSQWITRRDSADGALTSDWQATQLLLGILQWNEQSGHVDLLYRNRKSLDGNHSIKNYVRALDPDLLKKAKCGRWKYPRKSTGKNDDRGEIIALATIEAAKDGAVLIFTPIKRNIESIAEKLIEAIEIQEKINTYLELKQDVLRFGIHSREDKIKFDRCLNYAKESTGADSIIVKALKKGFVIHDGNVPHSLRVLLEELIREGILQVVVATTTLSQGVNLPVKTILIHSLYNRIGEEWKPLSARDFWNLCGRAGRALCETEGYVYVFAEPQKERDIRNSIDSYVRQAQSEEVISAIRQLLENVVRAWKQKFPHIHTDGIAMLCQSLTDNDERWLNNDDDLLTKELRAKLRILDSSLLALIEEQQILDITDPDEDLTTRIMNLFQDSLFYIQVDSKPPSKLMSVSDAISLLVQRVEHIIRVCNTTQRRQCYYRMGLSLEGCHIVERSKDELITYLKQAEDYMDWSKEKRAGYIVKLCEDFLMSLEDISGWKESDKPSACWPQVLEQWLLGKNASEIHASLNLPDECNTTMEISILIDKVCEFSLPWGLNAIAMFWQNSDGLSENADETPFTPPEIISYFASMLRFGVHDPVATVALAMSLDNRKAALALAEQYSGSVDAPSILSWLRTLDQNVTIGFTKDEMLQTLLFDFIASIQKRENTIMEFLQSLTPVTIDVEILGYADNLLTEEDTEVLSYYENGLVHFYTQTGEFLGTTANQLEDESIIRLIQSRISVVKIQKVILVDDTVFFRLLIRRVVYQME